MKQLRLLSLVAITSFALAQAGWAAGQGAAHGGFSGGIGGGHPGGGARGGAVGVPHFGGGSLGAPHINFGGAAYRGGGVGFGRYHPPSGVPQIANGPAPVRSFVPSRSPVLQSSSGHSAQGLTNVGRGNRIRNNQGRATTALNRPNSGGPQNARPGQVSRGTAPRPSNEAALGRQNHIVARESGGQHRDWDRRHAHFSRGHWFCWDGAYWIGLDAGYYPWDFYPYYAYDYYPYDYYTDVEPGYQNYTAAQADPNVSAVQADLAQLGYYNGPIDGLFGADTRSALTRYQIDQGLQVTGSLTTDTLQSLGLPPATSS
jgi:Putative peptidoglycan binding domain